MQEVAGDLTRSAGSGRRPGLGGVPCGGDQCCRRVEFVVCMWNLSSARGWHETKRGMKFHAVNLPFSYTVYFFNKNVTKIIIIVSLFNMNRFILKYLFKCCLISDLAASAKQSRR